MAIPAEFQQNQLSDPNAILGFFGDYRWLSNFHISPVTLDGVLYSSVENAFQAAKAAPDARTAFLACTPSQAKTLGKQVDMNYPVKYWDSIRSVIMYKLLKSKFSGGSHDLILQLLATKGKYLEETNWWGDKFWGVYQGVGQNTLGYLLMKVREEL
jgi:hypothetical protein